MHTLSVKVNEKIDYIGVNDKETFLFENMWELPKGVSYNSYLITDKKVAVMDTVAASKFEEFAFKIKEILGDRKVDYIVVLHVEPDHSGSLTSLMQLYPDAMLVGNAKTFIFLKQFYGIDTLKKIVVNEGDTISLGTYQLTFYLTPMVHWPESMVAYESTEKILFSQDVFGSFGVLEGAIFDDEVDVERYQTETERYYVNIVGKYSATAKDALDKLGGLEIKMILPVHGVLWRSNPGYVLDLYTRLITHQCIEGVTIVYGSMYGSTAGAAMVLARYLVEEGVRDLKIYDVSRDSKSEITTSMWKRKGIVLASATFQNGIFPPMLDLLNTVKSYNLQNHVLGVIGNSTWSGSLEESNELKAILTEFDQNNEFVGGAASSILTLKKYSGYDVLTDNIVEIRSSATKETYIKLKELAKVMAKKIKIKNK